MNHHVTPYFTKLVEYVKKDRVPFDVPGHKMGSFHNDMVDILGKDIFKMDVNAPDGLDNLNVPKGVIKEAQALFADAFQAEHAFFLTGGTTLGILALIMSTAKAKEKIIMPRNVHKSIISALIMSGAIPIFVEPVIDEDLGIANHMPLEALKKQIALHPDAKAVLIINPTYFGVASNIKDMIDIAHQHNMLVLADEAHGSHMVFSDQLPMTAMQAGADLSATSIHKTSGSLTQSSAILAQGSRFDYQRLVATIHMVQSTSPSALLLASLDVARKSMYFHAKDAIEQLLPKVSILTSKINQLKGLKAYTKEDFLTQGATHFDETKLIIKVTGLGLTGFDVYHILSEQYDIQVELAETKLVLCVLSVGTTQHHLDRLYEACVDLSNKYGHQDLNVETYKPKGSFPEAYVRPRSAYHAPTRHVKYEEAVGEIAAESVMIYPPGIPILIPGEIIDQALVEELLFYVSQGSTILSEAEHGYFKVVDKLTWPKWEEIDDEL